MLKSMPFELDGLTTIQKLPKIHCYGFEDLGDDPLLHRWRATWEADGSGIWLQAFPVIRNTPTGAWIAKYAYREATKQPWEDGAPAKGWNCDPNFKRWISNKSGASYAKPTKDDAIKSLAIRLTRWTCRIKAEYDRAMVATETLKELRPELSSYAETAKKNLSVMAKI